MDYFSVNYLKSKLPVLFSVLAVLALCLYLSSI